MGLNISTSKVKCNASGTEIGPVAKGIGAKVAPLTVAYTSLIK